LCAVGRKAVCKPILVSSIVDVDSSESQLPAWATVLSLGVGLQLQGAGAACGRLVGLAWYGVYKC
jgi:hypothetical protein